MTQGHSTTLARRWDKRLGDRPPLRGSRAGAAWVAAVIAGVMVLAGCAAPGGPGDGVDGGTPAHDGHATGSGAPTRAGDGHGLPSAAQRSARVQVEQAAIYFQQANYPAARQALDAALRLEPNDARAHGMLGLVHWRLADSARAQQSFEHALRLAPADGEQQNNYGWFLCQTGREQASIEHFERAVHSPVYLTPGKALHNAGVCALRAGNEPGAEQYLQRAVQADPANAVALFNLAELYLKRRDFARTQVYAQRLLAAYEPLAQTLWLALRAERGLGNRDAEQALAAQLRQGFPGTPEAALLAAGRYDD